MMRFVKTLLIACLLLVGAVSFGSTRTQADDGNSPFVFVDDGGSETDIPVPTGTVDPDASNSATSGTTTDNGGSTGSSQSTTSSSPSSEGSSNNGSSDNGSSDAGSAGSGTSSEPATDETPTTTTVPTDTVPTITLAPPTTEAAPPPPCSNHPDLPSVPLHWKQNPDGTCSPPPPDYCDATPTADIGVRATPDRTSYSVGSMVYYAVDVFVKQDRTDCAARDARFTFKVPPTLELLSPSAASAPEGDGRCEITGGVGSQLVTCYFGSIGAGHDVTVNVSAKADTAGTATAVAGVSTADADPDTSNQQYVVSLSITAKPTVPQKSSAPATQAPAKPVEQNRLRLPGTKPPRTVKSIKHLHPAADNSTYTLTLPTG